VSGIFGYAIGDLLSTTLIAIFSRCYTETVAVSTGKMRTGGEAAGQANLNNRLTGLQQHLTRPVQPQLKVILRGYAVEVLLENALKLTP
jgi:hypothetical protein